MKKTTPKVVLAMFIIVAILGFISIHLGGKEKTILPSVPPLEETEKKPEDMKQGFDVRGSIKVQIGE